MPFIFKHGGRNIDLESLGTDELFEMIEEIPADSEDELDDDIDNFDDIDTHSNSRNENVLEDNFDKPYMVHCKGSEDVVSQALFQKVPILDTVEADDILVPDLE
ncbi:hypothetical protein FQA39_LY02465 [Lamprigera yunnana]|nr:hypothetical protein FQA39_LY02465 [Lamprigera yunnana]